MHYKYHKNYRTSNIIQSPGINYLSTTLLTGIHWIRACPWFREPCVLVPAWKGHLSLYRGQLVTKVNNFANKLATVAICLLIISTYTFLLHFFHSTHNRGLTPQLILKCFRLEQHDTGNVQNDRSSWNAWSWVVPKWDGIWNCLSDSLGV